MTTPWGEALYAVEALDGITVCTTATGGGLYLDAQANEAIPASLRSPQGWYAFGSEADIVAWIFPMVVAVPDEDAARERVREAFGEKFLQALPAIHDFEVAENEAARAWLDRRWEVEGRTCTTEDLLREQGVRARVADEDGFWLVLGGGGRQQVSKQVFGCVLVPLA